MSTGHSSTHKSLSCSASMSPAAAAMSANCCLVSEKCCCKKPILLHGICLCFTPELQVQGPAAFLSAKACWSTWLGVSLLLLADLSRHGPFAQTAPPLFKQPARKRQKLSDPMDDDDYRPASRRSSYRRPDAMPTNVRQLDRSLLTAVKTEFSGEGSPTEAQESGDRSASMASEPTSSAAGMIFAVLANADFAAVAPVSNKAVACCVAAEAEVACTTCL